VKQKILMFAGIAALFGLSAVGSYYFFWSAPDWRKQTDTASMGVDEYGHPWIGAEKPELTIHEFLDYDCPHCPVAHQYLRKAVARDLDTIRIVRHDYARMACMFEYGDKVTYRCPMVRAAYCASKHVPYWKWNDEVVASPRHETGKEPAAYFKGILERLQIPEKEFTACMDSDESGKFAQKLYEEAHDAKINSTPTYVVDSRRMNLKELLTLLENR
jgi:protein-disulfide isomerase